MYNETHQLSLGQNYAKARIRNYCDDKIINYNKTVQEYLDLQLFIINPITIKIVAVAIIILITERLGLRLCRFAKFWRFLNLFCLQLQHFLWRFPLSFHAPSNIIFEEGVTDPYQNNAYTIHSQTLSSTYKYRGELVKSFMTIKIYIWEDLL